MRDVKSDQVPVVEPHLSAADLLAIEHLPRCRNCGYLTPEHEHRWARDNALTGQSCMDCQASGWDWHVDEVRRLRAELGRVTAWAKDEQAKRHAVEDKLVAERSTVAAQAEVIEAARDAYENAPLIAGWDYFGELSKALARLDAATGAEDVTRE